MHSIRLAALIALLACTAPATAQQISPLAAVCPTTSIAGKSGDTACTARYERVTPDSIVRHCTVQGSCYGAGSTWRHWRDVSGGRVFGCQTATTPGSTSCGSRVFLDVATVLRADDVTPTPSVGNGSAKVSWTAPATNTDSSPLTNLKGYVLRYGQKSGGPYPNAIEVNQPDTRSILVSDLGLGTWYFVVHAVNTLGIESAPSNEAAKTIAPAQPPTLALSCSPSDEIERVTPTCSWSSSNATTCTASEGWSGSKAVSGSEAVASITQTTRFTLTCTGPGGQASQTAIVNVSPRPSAPVIEIE